MIAGMLLWPGSKQQCDGHGALLHTDLFMVETQRRDAAHLELLVGHVLAQLLGHALEVLEGDLASLVVIKQPERLRSHMHTAQ